MEGRLISSGGAVPNQAARERTHSSSTVDPEAVQFNGISEAEAAAQGGPTLELPPARSRGASDSKSAITPKSASTPKSDGSRDKVPLDSVTGELPDPGALVASRRVRFLLFLAFCQGVQMFMSYDGGATPASLDTIQEEMDNSWSSSEFGLLGSIDKIGMTATSALWGRCLQLLPAKVLLAIGLFLNALATLSFGSLRNKGLMYAAKLVMGATQALQGVWGTVWTMTMAPPGSRTAWLGLGAVSAGVGNGIGTAVAGLGTANGLPYAFAFQLQGCVLVAFLVGMFITPASKLTTRLPQGSGGSGASSPSSDEEKTLNGDAMSSFSGSGAPVGAGGAAPSTLAQLRALCNNRVYCWTCLAISLIMFEVSGIQFLWVRVFTEVWSLDKSFVTTMFLLVSGVGGGIGIALGPAHVDRIGGFNSPPGVLKCLRFLRHLSGVAAVAGIGGCLCLYGRGKGMESWTNEALQDGDGPWGDRWLWLTWFLIAVIWAAHNACVAALCGINMEVVPQEMRTFASGCEMTARNILGYALGPLLPGLVMDSAETSLEATRGDHIDTTKSLRWGLAFVLLCNILGMYIMGRAKTSAKRHLNDLQNAVLQNLREATAAEDIQRLQQAVQAARHVALETRPDGASVIGMANQIIGGHPYSSSQPHKASIERSLTQTEWKAKFAELLRRVEELEAENAKLRDENTSLLRSKIVANVNTDAVDAEPVVCEACV